MPPLHPACYPGRPQVPVKSLERSFMFTTGFQSCTAMATNMQCAIGVLTADPVFAEELRKEVDGQASTYTYHM